MAVGLAYSIRQYEKDIDIYCGDFTNNKINKEALYWLDKFNVKYVNETFFNNIGKNDSFCFLRTFCKNYFAKTILDNYDFLIYLDVDVVQFNKINFNFDPVSPMVLVHTMPNWVKKYHSSYLSELKGFLYYNWVDIINNHNKHLYEIDWSDPKNLVNHNSDVIFSNKIIETKLNVIEQNFGSYHEDFKPNDKTIFHHYDDLGESGSLYLLEEIDSLKYKKIVMFFENILKIKVENNKKYWKDFYMRHR